MWSWREVLIPVGWKGALILWLTVIVILLTFNDEYKIGLSDGRTGLNKFVECPANVRSSIPFDIKRNVLKRFHLLISARSNKEDVNTNPKSKHTSFHKDSKTGAEKCRSINNPSDTFNTNIFSITFTPGICETATTYSTYEYEHRTIFLLAINIVVCFVSIFVQKSVLW